MRLRLCVYLVALALVAAIPVFAGEVTDDGGFTTMMTKGNSLGIVCHPPAFDFTGMDKLTSIPTWDPAKAYDVPFQVDLRSQDVSKLDLKGHEKDLMYANFDAKTKWPEGFKGVGSFIPDKIMELGKNPGLGVRSLHEKGITGKGVGIAIIDQALLVDHQEYKDQLKLYEEIHCADDQAMMHGAAVASIAVGKTVGVAPGADLYYIAATNSVYNPSAPNPDDRWADSIAPIAKGIDRIIEINKILPKDHKIRVISVSRGWMPETTGREAVEEAVRRAEKEGIFVITCSLEQTSGGEMASMELGREPLLDPDNPKSYESGLFGESFYIEWWAKMSAEQRSSFLKDQLCIPMDSRTCASPTGPDDYVFYRTGGQSWTIPYMAGLYALACQARPKVTPEQFWAAALATGDIVPVDRDGKKYKIGMIVNPVKLIAKIKAG